jgi:AcrR family transcriptional regulator
MAQPSNRERLIEGAISCLRVKGYARTTARDIAAASGANLASIGYHFGSKEALLNEAMIRIFEERTARLDQVTSTSGDASPLEHLATTFSSVLAMFETHRPILVAFLEAIAQSERSEELRARMAAHYRQTRTAVAQRVVAAFAGTTDELPDDPAVFASFLIATLDGLVVQWLLDSADTPTGQELVASLQDTMAVALGHSGRPQNTEGRRPALKGPPTTPNR